MAAHFVKCLYCGEQFDTNEESFVKINRRYAHTKCAEKQDSAKIQEEKDFDELYQYCKHLFGKEMDFVSFKRLAEKYKQEYGYSYNGMTKTLKWFYEIKGNSIEKANASIGIIPYVYAEAREYYYKIYQAIEKNQNYIKEDSIREINIASPRQKIKHKKLWFDDEPKGEIFI